MMQIIISVQCLDDSCFCVLLFLMYYCLCRAVLGKNECACASTREWGMWYLWFAWYCIGLGVR